jgi:hypothetical protein
LVASFSFMEAKFNWCVGEFRMGSYWVAWAGTSQGASRTKSVIRMGNTFLGEGFSGVWRLSHLIMGAPSCICQSRENQSKSNYRKLH